MIYFEKLKKIPRSKNPKERKFSKKFLTILFFSLKTLSRKGEKEGVMRISEKKDSQKVH